MWENGNVGTVGGLVQGWGNEKRPGEIQTVGRGSSEAGIGDVVEIAIVGMAENEIGEKVGTGDEGDGQEDGRCGANKQG